jgi:acyl-CoA synthetase (AMP-forming)/AMP-acid ligase II
MTGERLAQTLLESDGDSPALETLGPPGAAAGLSYAQLRERVARVANGVRSRAARVVLLSSPNSCELVASLLAVLEAGAKALLLPADFPEAALAQAARAARADLAIARLGDPRLAALDVPVAAEAELAEEASAAAPGGLAGAVLLPTSGTTGAAKLVQRSEGALLALARGASQAFGLAHTDRVALALPLCHSYGLDLLLATLAAGARAQLHAGFQLGAMRRALREREVTVLPGVPVMLDALSRGDAFDAPRLRLVLSSGSPLPVRVFERFRAASGLSIGQFYGATEFGSVAYNDPSAPGFDPAQVGAPIGEARLRIVASDGDGELPRGSIGRIAVSGPTLMDGYLREPSPLRDGWFVTGDLGVQDARGRLRVVGRSALLIDVGGKKVNPTEVERVLALHPDVREAVVLEDAARDTVARLVAIVVPEPGATPDPEKLRRFAREQLPPHMLPRRYEVCENPPRSSTGKILRAQLQAARARA